MCTIAQVYEPNPQLRVNPGGRLDQSQVVGRDALIESIWGRLEQQSVLLTSERRMGKTCVMRKMREEPPLRTCPVQRSLQGINKPEEFARALVADIEANASGVLAKPFLKRLRKAGVKRVGAKSVEVEFEPATDEAWKDVVVETFETIDSGVDERLVFLWDELPHMVEAIEGRRDAGTARDVLDVLRHVRETYPSVRMVLSGSLGIHHVVDRLRLEGGSWAPTNDVTLIDVPPLDGLDATYLAGELLHNESIECEGDEGELAGAIASQVDCVPYYIHHVVDQLRQRGGSPASESAVTEVVEGVLTDPDDPLQLRHYVDRVPVYYPREVELAYAVLDVVSNRPEGHSQAEIANLLAAQMEPPDAERLHDLLELLCKDHYLEPGYRFRLELVRRAWRAKRPFL